MAEVEMTTHDNNVQLQAVIGAIDARHSDDLASCTNLSRGLTLNAMRNQVRFAVFLLFVSLLAGSSAFGEASFDIGAAAKKALEISYAPDLKSALVSISKGDYQKGLENIPVRPAAARVAARGAERRHIVQALAYLGLQKTGEAEISLREALSLRASSSDASFLLGATLTKLKKYSLALVSFQDALWFKKFELFSEGDVYLALGDIQTILLQPTPAAKSFESALAANPSSVTARLAVVEQVKDADRARAIKLLRDGLVSARSGDGAEDLQLKLGEILFGASDKLAPDKDLKEARDLSESVRSSKSSTSALKRSATLLLIRTLTGLGDLEKAKMVLNEAKRSYPRDLDLSRLARQVSLESSITKPEVENGSKK